MQNEQNFYRCLASDAASRALLLGPSEINHFESGEINQNRSNKNRQFDSCYFMKAPK